MPKFDIPGPPSSSLFSPLSSVEPLLSTYYVPATVVSPGATAKPVGIPLHIVAWSWEGNEQSV